MMDWTPTYKVQAETRALDQNTGMACTGFWGTDKAEEEWDQEEVTTN